MDKRITIGTDPEFILINNHNEIEKARNFPFFDHTHRYDRIGCDGAGTPVEIRPEPSFVTNIDVLMKNIEKILREVAVYVQRKGFRMVAGANWKGSVPIGGHIHFGSKRLSNYDTDRWKLIRLLDCYFTPLTCFFLTPREIIKRIETGYGNLSSRESKHYGFEYRTPYSFMFSPFFTRAFFSLAALIAFHYRKLHFSETLYQKVKKHYYNQRLSTSDKKLKEIYNLIKPKILLMMSWNSPNQKYNPYILSLFNLIEREKKCNCKEVLRNYGYTRPASPYLHVMFSGDDYVETLQSRMLQHINNKKSGDIYIYGVGKRGEVKPTLKNCVFLSTDLPKLKLPKGIKLEYQSFGAGIRHKNSIGLSYNLRKEIALGKTKPGFLVKYINGLKLKKKSEKYV